MKSKKALSLTVFTLSTLSLTGCGFQAAINTMALSAAMQLPYIVNNVDLETKALAQFETMPTSLANQAEISYVQNVLAIPKSISISQSGINVQVDFEIESEGLDNFLIFEQSLNDLAGEGGDSGQGMPEGLENLELTAYILIPIGTGDYTFREDETATSSITAFADYLQSDFDVIDVLKITEQDMVELSIDVTGKIGEQEKTKTFYFQINETSLDDLAALADTSIAELGVPEEIAEYVSNWPEEPQPEVIDYVGDNWPAEIPQEMVDNWEEITANVPAIPDEWLETWPSPEEAETWLEENWPEDLSDYDWLVDAGILGMANSQPQP